MYHQSARALLAPFVVSLSLLLPIRLPAAPQTTYNDIMPINQVKAGMKGYGLTVFHGTTIEKFAVTVVGVVKKGSLVVPGHDMILVRMSGGPMTTRQANLIRGMSGSPVYIQGKIIGAFSQGEPATKEPLGGVTPIEDMLEAWDPKLPDSPLTQLPDNRTKIYQLAAPIHTGNRTISRVVTNVPHNSTLKSSGATLVMRPCTAFATFGSLSRTARDKMTRLLEPYNVELVNGVAGGGAKPGFTGSPLAPGSAFSMMLATGDLTMGATGTLTYRRGDRVLGFGHPFMGIGPIDAPLCSAWVYDVYPLLSGSYKISSPGPIVGSSMQDRNFSISGMIGKMPKLIPVTVGVRDTSTGRSRVFNIQVVSHPNLWAGLVSGVTSAAVNEVRSIPGSAMARVETSIVADEIGKITRSNIVYDARGIDGAATEDLDDLLTILTSNPFYPVRIKSANIKVDIESGRKTAQIERIFLKEGRFSPGETVEIGVVIKPYKLPGITRVMRIEIPQNTPNGQYALMVRGGAVPAGISMGGIILRLSGTPSTEQAPPANIGQMIKRYNEREKNNDIVARLILPSTAVSVDGEKLSNLPPTIDTAMRSARSSGVRLERDEVKTISSTDWILSGQQALMLTVQRHDSQEAPSSSTGGTIGGVSSGASSSAGMLEKDFSADSDDSMSTFSGMVFSAGKKPVANSSSPPGKTPVKPDTALSDASASGSPAAPDAGASVAPASEKPVGRLLKVWRQTTRDDFAHGDLDGLSVTTRGDLVITRTLNRFTSSSESFVWSLLPDDKGGLYAGTGAQGHLLQIGANGKSAVLATLPEVSIHALLKEPSGDIIAATAPAGRIYRIKQDGNFTVLYQTKEKYALALVRDANGNIYIGTGGGTGAIYRIKPDGTAALFYKTAEQHVLSLAVDSANNLYAGTGQDGVVYRISPEGKGMVLYNTTEKNVTGLAVNAAGTVYAATAPRGVIYRISSDGTCKTLLDKAPSGFTSLIAGIDKRMIAAAGGTVYIIQPDDTLMPMDNGHEVDFLSLAMASDGSLFAGAGNVADIYMAAPLVKRPKGIYESVVHDASLTSRWGSIRWNITTPPGTRALFQTRSGNVSDPDATWSAWTMPRPNGDGGQILSPPARFIQYRVVLESNDQGITPALRDISISYLPGNQAPKVAFIAPLGGERWSGKQTIKWSASDQDKDTLSYDLLCSSDEGRTWKPVPSGATTTTPTVAPVKTNSPAAKAPSDINAGGRPTVEEITAELDKHPDMPAALREAVLKRAREQNASTVATAVAAPIISSKDTTRTLDSKLMTDGSWRFKVVATDKPSNPVDPLITETISEQVVICNTPPTLYLLKASQHIQADRTFSLEGAVMQKLTAVSAVQYRVDSGEWIAATPADGLFDSPLESFSFSTAPLTVGSHIIEVKAFNTAGTTSLEKVTVAIK